MKSITITFVEPLHHICLMYGLKQTFNAMPHLNRRVVEVAGRSTIVDNFVSPPPMLKNPKARAFVNLQNPLVELSYWRERATIEYQDCCSEESIKEFAEALVTNYIALRYPFTETTIEDGKVVESKGGKLIAEIA